MQKGNTEALRDLLKGWSEMAPRAYMKEIFQREKIKKYQITFLEDKINYVKWVCPRKILRMRNLDRESFLKIFSILAEYNKENYYINKIKTIGYQRGDYHFDSHELNVIMKNLNMAKTSQDCYAKSEAFNIDYLRYLRFMLHGKDYYLVEYFGKLEIERVSDNSISDIIQKINIGHPNMSK